MANVKRIIPTNEELKLLRDKISHFQDLGIFNLDRKKTSPKLGSKSKKSYGKFEEDQEELHVLNPNVSDLNIGSHYLQGSNKLLLLNDQREDEDQEVIQLHAKNAEETEKEKENQFLINRLLDENKRLKAEITELKSQVESLRVYENITTKQMTEINLNEFQSELGKLKREIITLKNDLKEKNQVIFRIEQDKKLLMEINKTYYIPNQGSLSNLSAKGSQSSLVQASVSNTLKYYLINLFLKKEFIYKENNFTIIKEIFGKEMNFVKFLDTRIESLEYQNYFLLSKSEKYANSIKYYVDELIEYHEVVKDIKNALNQVYENQSITNEFLIIRDELNSKKDYLDKKVLFFKEEKQKMDEFLLNERNEQVLLCNDKFYDYLDKRQREELDEIELEKLLELVDERVEVLEKMKIGLVNYDEIMQRELEEGEGEVDLKKFANTRLRDIILNENMLLKADNLKMKRIMANMMKDLSGNFKTEKYEEISYILNHNDEVFSNNEIFEFMRTQALMIENCIIP